jgi:hypothetical protein
MVANDQGDSVKGFLKSHALASILCATSGEVSVAFPKILPCWLRFQRCINDQHLKMMGGGSPFHCGLLYCHHCFPFRIG